MGKKQIKVSADSIRALIREELDSLGNQRYPEGVFSTDSEEGERYKEISKSYDRPDSDRVLKDGHSLMDYPATGEPWGDHWHSIWDKDAKRDKLARDEFGDEEEESRMYDENPEGEENLYFGDPDLEQDDDEDDIAGINEVRLNEEGLRNLISYSVAKLLKEAYGKPFYGQNGEFDNFEDSKYGTDSTVITPDLDQMLDDLGDNGEGDALVDELDKYGMWPIKVKVHYTTSRGARGDGYLQPDDPDTTNVDDWEIVGEENITDEQMRDMVHSMVERYMEGFDADNELSNLNEEEFGGDSFARRVSQWSSEHPIDHKKNPGITFGGKDREPRPENPYEDMTWDEYVEAKRLEADKAGDDIPGGDEKKPNLGITAHFDGKKREKTPEDLERDDHMFDDEYWADKMRLTEADIRKMVHECVRRLTEGLGDVESRFPTKASGTFTEKYGKTDVKCKVYVANHDGEVVIDILQYGPEGWEPEMEWMFDVEEYTDGAWLPYWESLGGDASMKSLARFWPKIMKALVKIGYLADEDDEIPFRFVGDIKGIGGKRI